MYTLPTMARKTWVEQLSIFTAACLSAIGCVSLAGWWLPSELLLQPIVGIPVVVHNEALCWFLLGAGLLAVELKAPKGAFLGIISGIIAFLTIYEHLPFADFGIDQLIVTDTFRFDSKADPGRMAVITASCIFLSSILLSWKLIRLPASLQLFANAIFGSLIGAIGLSSLLGFTINIEVIYRWGFNTAVAPGSAIALIAVGLYLLADAWRESTRSENIPPVWAPMPAVIASLTISVVFWVGMREREARFISDNTNTELNSFVSYSAARWSNLLTTLDAKFRAVRYVSRDQIPGYLKRNALDIIDRTSDLTAYGIVDISIIDSEFKYQTKFPSESQTAFSLSDPTLEEARKEALAKIKRTLEPERPFVGKFLNVVTRPFKRFASPSGDSPLFFAIYLPLYLDNHLIAVVCVDIDANKFYGNLEYYLGVRSNFDFIVRHDQVIAFGDRHIEESLHHPLFFSKAFSVKDVPSLKDIRLHFGVVPTQSYLSENKRYLPELTLISGLGITLLIGLSIHFARNARGSLIIAENSNKQLFAENEERRRIEERLKSSDERLRLALDSTGIGILEWNVPTGYVYYSHGLWITLGYEPSRMAATVEALQSLIHPEDFASYRKRTEAQLCGSSPFIDPEFRVRDHRGEWRWVYLRSRTVSTAPNKTPVRILGTLQDVTARREAEETLRASQAATRKLSMVASRTDNLVIIFTPDGRVEWVNESFTRTTEYQLIEIAGKRLVEFLAGPDTDARAIGRIRTALAHGQAINTDIVQYTKSQRKFHLSYDIQPIRNKSSEIENYIAVAADITARVETEQALRRAKSEADAASRAKSEFLASMSHEIRTPMNGVIGMTSLLLETKLDSDQREYVSTIRSSGEALLSIINDILDFSKIESGKMELERLPFTLDSVVEEAIELFVVQAASKRLELAYHIDRNVPAAIISDVTRLRQVLVNLINNAIKFTPTGSISISVRIAPGDPNDLGLPPGHILLEFSVRDTGIGIPEDRINRLFKAFSQVDSSTTRKYGGTGLGLAICQRICDLMGGSIRVESEQTKGSNFIFTIQTEVVPHPGVEESPPLPAALRDGAKVIIVEDHPLVQRRLMDLFNAWGAQAVVADNASQAQLLLQEFPHPGLLVLDYDDSDLNRFFSNYRTVTAPRLVMVPLGNVPPDTTTDNQSYMFITKPIKSAGLYQAVASLFASFVSQSVSASAPTSSSVLGEEIPLDILLVEDNPVNQKVALRFLDRLGYRANAAGNGIEAINALETRRYHLILMDMQMPEMDGLEASRQIRKRFPQEQQPKIIALTANALQGDREICMEAGMDDYITKPVKLAEIEAAIRRQFQIPAKKA